MEKLQGRNFLSLWRTFEEIQYLSPGELKSRQEMKLRSLLKHAYENVSFYRKRFDSSGLKPDNIQNIEDLVKFPRLTKSDLRNRAPDEIVAKNVSRNRVIPDRTSGSSGEPFRFFRDRNSRDITKASFLLFDQWAGIYPGDLTLHIGAPVNASFKERISNRLQRRIDLSVFDLETDTVGEWLRNLARLEPDLIEGYSSAIYRIAHTSLEKALPIRPKAVVYTSDTLPSVEPVRKAFQCGVFNRYGNRELSGAVAQSCPEGQNLHVNTELCILEVVDDNGKQVEAFQKGRVLLTDLSNQVMPLIRYDTGDTCVLGNFCQCGRGFPSILSLEGRSSEFLITPAGAEITPVALGHFLFVKNDYASLFTKFQAEQRDSRSYVFRFVSSKRIGEEIELKLSMALKELIGKDSHIVLEFVDDILPESSGKQRIIIAQRS